MNYNFIEIDINNFTKGEILGSGGFGEVFIAEDNKSDRVFAAKTIRKDERDDKSDLRIQRELDILLFVNHPTIVKLFGYSRIDFSSENNVTLFMEYMEKGSLRSILSQFKEKNHPEIFNNTLKQIILVGIARGMKYLHDCNIIHRDLKPDNVLLDDNYHPHITDFGLSKWFSGDSKNQTEYGGTLLYMSPEVLDGEPYGRKSDVYSFFVLLYEVVMEEMPKRTKALKFNDSIKKSIQYLIEMCGSNNPEERPTFHEIYSKLTDFEDSEEGCILEDVNIEKVKRYIEIISEIKTPIDIMHKNNAENEQIKEQLTDEVAQLTKEKIYLEENNSQLEKDKIDLEESNRQLTKEKNALEDINRRLKKDKSTHKDSDLEESNRQLEREKSGLEESNRQLKREKSGLEESNRQLKREKSGLEESNRQLTRENSSLKSDILKLQNELNELKSERSSHPSPPPPSSLPPLHNPPRGRAQSIILGIDFGTSSSSIGFFNAAEKGSSQIKVLSREDIPMSVPSSVLIKGNSVIVGENAVKKSTKMPKNFVYDIKRMLGKKFDDPEIKEHRKYWTFDAVSSESGGIMIKIDGRHYEPYVITGMILKELKKLMNSKLDQKSNTAVISIPSYFNHEQIEDLRRAAQYAQIGIMNIILENEASSLTYSYRNDTKSRLSTRHIIIFDCGGGKTSISFVKLEKNSFNLVSSSENKNLGGQNFTNSLFDLISSKLDECCAPGWRRNAQFVATVRRHCEQAKINLSRSNDNEIYIEIPREVQQDGNSIFEYRVTRSEFEFTAKPLFNMITKMVKDFLTMIDFKETPIENLVLFGGSSCIPRIAAILNELVGKKGYRENCDSFIAFGSCVYARNQIIKPAEREEEGEDKKTFPSSSCTSEITLGIVKKNQYQNYYMPVVKKGMSLPYDTEIKLLKVDLNFEEDSRRVNIPIFVLKNNTPHVFCNIEYCFNGSLSGKKDQPVLFIRFKFCSNGFQYAFRTVNGSCSSYRKVSLHFDKSIDSDSDDEDYYD